MTPPFAPSQVAPVLIEALQDRAYPSYGQAATVDGRGRAQVRTVHLRWLPERSTLGFNAHMSSPKWGQLRREGRLSGVYHDQHRLVQFRWEGPVELVEASSEDATDRAMLDRTWALIRPEVRLAYWRDWGRAARPDLALRAPNLGLAVCRPKLWDVFVLHATDYNKGRRTLYELKGNVWRARRVSLLHSR